MVGGAGRRVGGVVGGVVGLVWRGGGGGGAAAAGVDIGGYKDEGGESQHSIPSDESEMRR